MRGKGKSVGRSQSRTCSGRKTLKKCKNNREADNVVVIDVDGDDIDGVIIVDVSESLKQKLRGSNVLRKEKKRQLRTVICIDDDETNGNHPASNHSPNSADAGGDDCELVQDHLSPLNLSKSKRTYSGKASTRNCYGLGPEPDSGSSDKESPDCEFMDDCFGKLREQWEKANMKKKSDVRNRQSGTGDPATTSESTSTQQEVEVENMTNQHEEANVPLSSNASFEEENPSPFSQTGVENSGRTSSNSFCGEEDRCYRRPSSCSSPEQGSKRVNHAKRSSQDKEKTLPTESFMSNPEPTADMDSGCSKASFPDKEASHFGTQHSSDTEVGGRDNLQQAPSSHSHFPNNFENGSSSSMDKEKSAYGESSFLNTKSSDETQDGHGVVDNAVGAVPGEKFCEDPPLGKSGFDKEKACCQDKANIEPEMGAREVSSEFMSNLQYEEKNGPFHAEDGDVLNTAEGCIINEREKLKETDEYKRAVEEEWASRQRELQLQAEEAQRLRLVRKRKKAESMRLLDMARRQKQRVEEIREVQKKDEENMNLKEQLRAEVRKELKQLEITCQNMALLLRGLGIHVGGELNPLPHEVRAAYKRALLKFHPDRASGSDICALVEAEEKFKLISRMKEKLLP